MTLPAINFICGPALSLRIAGCASPLHARPNPFKHRALNAPARSAGGVAYPLSCVSHPFYKHKGK
jgi:hypothetical protein